ncbi:unnamed protein product [Clonostachys chloroleuca]|uniref:Uncharacterized protein n=1 Tax=Clonostachys chloroleuca TaxID=1926264 RepID=A0AA35QDP1_9HYPO|nr:unnamed protein product [Clonostachys chloroleuca]
MASLSKIILSLGVITTLAAASPLQIYEGCKSSGFGQGAYNKVIPDKIYYTYPNQTEVVKVADDTYAFIMPFLDVNKKAVTSQKWGSWNLDGFKPNKQVPGQEKDIECADEIYLWERLKLVTVEKNMYLKVDEKNGWYISYQL